MTIKNTSELREFLLTRLENLAKGEESVQDAHAHAALAKQINATLALDIAAIRVGAGEGKRSLRLIK